MNGMCDDVKTFPKLSKSLVIVIASFMISYICETEFSALVDIKPKRGIN